MASRHYGEFEMLDYSESKSSFSVNFGAITPVSLPGFLTDFGALRTALGNITVGTIRRERWIGDETILSNIPPVNSAAQREIKWWVDYYESVEPYREGTLTIACPDLALLSSDGWNADYANPAIAAFITSFEAIVVDSVSGASVIVDRIQLVGRAT